MAFVREATNEFFAFRYINAFYGYYFVLEGLYSAGRWRNHEVAQAFASSPPFAKSVEWCLKFLRQERGPIFAQLLGDMGIATPLPSVEEVARYLTVAPPRNCGAPTLSRHFRLISHRHLPYHDPMHPFAADIRFRSERTLQPVRIRVTCNSPIASAVAAIEYVIDDVPIECYTFDEKLVHGNTLTFQFSDPALDPKFVCLVEVRSPHPISILSVERLPGGVPPGTRGRDTATMARQIRTQTEALKAEQLRRRA